MADFPLRIGQFNPSTGNQDGIPATTSPDIANQLDLTNNPTVATAADIDAINSVVLFNNAALTAQIAIATAAANAAAVSAASAITLASAAQTSANGRNTVMYAASAPTVHPDGSALVADDLWYQTASGNITGVNQWTGSAWTALPIANNAIFANIDAGKITAGTLSGINVIGNTVETQANVGTGTSPSVVTGVLLTTSGNMFAYTNTGPVLSFVASTGALTLTGATGTFTAPAITGGVISGATLIASAVGAGALSGVGTIQSSKNLSITNSDASTDATYWSQGHLSGSAPTISQQTGLTVTGTSLTTAMQYVWTAGANVLAIAEYQFRDDPTNVILAGSTYTVSFYAKSISGSTNMSCFMSDASIANVVMGGQNFTITTSWARYSFTFKATISSLSSTLLILNNLTPANAYTYQVTGVQIEVGSSATVYSNPISSILALDQSGNLWSGSGRRTSAPFQLTPAGALSVTNGTIVGGTIATQAGLVAGGTNIGVQMSSTADDRVNFFTGVTQEVGAGYIQVTTTGSGGTTTQGIMNIVSPTMHTGLASNAAQIQMQSSTPDNTTAFGLITLTAPGTISLQAGTAGGAGILGALTIGATDIELNTFSLSRGVMGHATATTAVTATTTETAIMSGVAGFTVISGRRYRVTGFWIGAPSATSTTAISQTLVRLGSGTAGAALAQCNVPTATTGNTTFFAYGEFVGGTDVTAGAQTFSLTAKAGTGSLVGSTATNAANRQSITIEDIGT